MGNKNYPKTYAITAAQAFQNPSSALKYGLEESAGKPNFEFIESFDCYCKEQNAGSIIQAIRGSYVNEIELDKFFRDRDKDVYMESSAYNRLCSERVRELTRRNSWLERVEKRMQKSQENVLLDCCEMNSGLPQHYFWNEVPTHEYNSLNFQKLNKKIYVLEPQTPPQNEDPSSGNRDLPQDYFGASVIVPSSKQRFVSVPKDLGGKSPRLFLSTGCCTHPNYNQTNFRGKKAFRHHQYGFAVVDVLGSRKYLTRLVPALENGTFVDLGVKYSSNKDPQKIRAKALVLGDVHIPFQDKNSINASLEMIEYFKPENIYIHDFLDFNCINHHEAEKSLWRMNLVESGCDKLESELELGIKFLKKMSEVATGKVYVVPSNHDRFVLDWINSGRYLKDPKNMRLGGGIVKDYTTEKSICQIALEQLDKIPQGIEFLLLNDDQRPEGYECSAHGHLGVDGSRGTLKQYKTSYGKVIIGHTHTLEVNGHSFSAGTNSKIPLEYQKGHPSKAMAGNIVIYDDELVQAIPIIEGRWRK